MKEVEFFRWWLPPDGIWHKKRHLSRWAMSREDAQKRYPGAEPDLSTREVRTGSSELEPADSPLVAKARKPAASQSPSD